MSDRSERIVPQLPPAGQRMRLIIDTDIANEIDDLYAVGLALHSPDRLAIEGFIATHFAQNHGRESIEMSYRLLKELLAVAGMSHVAPVVRGGDPMRFRGEPCASEGADLIIERAHAGSADDPLWVVALGAASNLASAILKDPTIIPKVRYVFHARSELTWPERNDQFNVYGDVWAARTLLDSDVPLVWFDTGQQLVCPMETTASRLVPTGPLGKYLHEYRLRSAWFQAPEKGFYDVADIAWMIDPSLCTNEVIPAPTMSFRMTFDHSRSHVRMLRVSAIRPEPAWELFFSRMASS